MLLQADCSDPNINRLVLKTVMESSPKLLRNVLFILGIVKGPCVSISSFEIVFAATKDEYDPELSAMPKIKYFPISDLLASLNCPVFLSTLG